MNSVRLKIILLVLSSIIISSLFIGGISIINSRRVIKDDSIQIMNLLCENRTNELNSLFVKIEQSVETLTVYAEHQITDINEFKNNDQFVKEYSDSLVDVALNAALNTDGAITVYIRFNPEFTDTKAGFFYTRQKGSENFTENDTTDLGLYDSSNEEYVGWFYNAVEKEAGTWIPPYYNRNIGVEMISYTIPFYINGELIGVVGMDIDFDFLIDVIANTSVYQSGYAFLVDEDGKVVFHRELERGTVLMDYNNGEFNNLAQAMLNNNIPSNKLIEYKYMGHQKKSTFRKLTNGMQLVLTAPTSEIDAQQNTLIIQIVGEVIIITLIMAFMTIIFTRRLVRPLTELTAAAKKIADGDLSVSITHQSKDEVGILAESFRQTVTHLKEYFSDINKLAYLDSLTGVKNKTAYFELTRELDKKIGTEDLQYGVIVFDINGLKMVNDSYGHDKGDVLIMDACEIICKIFKKSPVCRIGGDEFVVLLQNDDYMKRAELLKRLSIEIEEHNSDTNNRIKVSFAWGVSIFVRDIDICYNDVFKKADHAMYCHKIKMKRNTQNQ